MTASNERVGIDASAALAFVFSDDRNHARAVALVSALDKQGATFCAPPMFSYEVDSVIRLREWKGEFNLTDAEDARALIAALGVEIEYDPNDKERAFEIARDYDQPRVYDAAYAAHAEARGVELLTTDKPFFDAVNGAKKPTGKPALSFVKLLS